MVVMKKFIKKPHRHTSLCVHFRDDKFSKTKFGQLRYYSELTAWAQKVVHPKNARPQFFQFHLNSDFLEILNVLLDHIVSCSIINILQHYGVHINVFALNCSLLVKCLDYIYYYNIQTEFSSFIYFKFPLELSKLCEVA